MATEVKLPLPAEEVETVEVVNVRVAPGDMVREGQALLEVEVEKSTVEVPAPMAGRVTEVRVKKGDQLRVGQTICLIEEEAAAGKPAPAESPKATEKPAPQPTAVPAKPAPSAAKPTPKPPARPSPQKESAADEDGEPAPAPKPQEAPAAVSAAGDIILAGPATRQLARELGVDLRDVPANNGRVSQEDVKSFVRQRPTGGGAGPQIPRLPDFAKWGPIDTQPLDNVRRLTIQQMNLSWSLIPHVTQHDQADITALEAFRKQPRKSDKETKLTVTAFALKAAALALQEFPTFNASLDPTAGQLILKRYCHIGVAVDTERGLLVPVLQDVDKKSIAELARELADVATQARAGKAQMKGGTFTISNLGGIGGTGFTPIINYPEVAILGLSRATLTPLMRDGQVVPRLLMPLSLSYDHRVIDGAAAARFTRRIAEMLENPLEMLILA